MITVSQLLLSLGLGLETTGLGLGLGRECVGLGLECLGLIGLGLEVSSLESMSGSCRAMLCKRGLCCHAVSVCHVRELCQNE